ncbi:MAG: MAPEG family protein [Caulobacteraceae bacterium]
MVDALALAYIALRFGYTAAYLAGMGSLRSGLWAFALILNIALLLSPWWAGQAI